MGNIYDSVLGGVMPSGSATYYRKTLNGFEKSDKPFNNIEKVNLAEKYGICPTEYLQRLHTAIGQILIERQRETMPVKPIQEES